MKIRVKFAKRGTMKFVGHLDLMRYFQKAIKRAGIDIAYSAGFSPHQILSFAAPLGLGCVSEGEYLDMEVNSISSTEEMKNALQNAMVEEMEILSVRALPDKAKNAMALVAGADYEITLRQGYKLPDDWQKRFMDFFGQPEITVLKKTKKSEKEVDIRPMIYQVKETKEGIFMQLASGSAKNLKPELVMESFCHFLGVEYKPLAMEVKRLEMYGNTGSEDEVKLVALEDFGCQEKYY